MNDLLKNLVKETIGPGKGEEVVTHLTGGTQEILRGCGKSALLTDGRRDGT
jgi:hypothetical protein